MLCDVGVIVRDVLRAGGNDLPSLGQSTTATGVITALDDLNQRLSRATGGKLDLKLLFPLTLGALGLCQVLAEGLGLTEIPGYVLLWYAFDSFYKLHEQRPQRVAVAAVEERQRLPREPRGNC